MRKFIKQLTIASLLTLSLFAKAGTGLSVASILNLAAGNVIGSAIGGGLGAASLSHGIRMLQKGKVGWGVFFTILAEKDIITEGESALLSNSDIATQEAFISIITDENMTESEKAELLAELDLG